MQKGLSERQAIIRSTGRMSLMNSLNVLVASRPRRPRFSSWWRRGSRRIRHPASMKAHGHPLRQRHDRHWLSRDIARVEDEEVGPVALAIVAKEEQPAVVLGGARRVRREDALRDRVAIAERRRRRLAGAHVIAPEERTAEGVCLC